MLFPVCVLVFIFTAANDRAPFCCQSLSQVRKETLKTQTYGHFKDWLETRGTSHGIMVASMVAGKDSGVCPQGKVTLVKVDHQGDTLKWNSESVETSLGWYMPLAVLEQVVVTLEDIKSKQRGTKAVVNMSWGINSLGKGKYEDFNKALRKYPFGPSLRVSHRGRFETDQMTAGYWPSCLACSIYSPRNREARGSVGNCCGKRWRTPKLSDGIPDGKRGHTCPVRKRSKRPPEPHRCGCNYRGWSNCHVFQGGARTHSLRPRQPGPRCRPRWQRSQTVRRYIIWYVGNTPPSIMAELMIDPHHVCKCR